MILPEFIVRVAFASDAFDAVPVWTDISDDVMAFSIRRGRQYETNHIETGVATLKLKNTSGNYWPSGIYSPNLVPVKRLNIRAVYDSITYDLYTGYVEDWAPGFISAYKGPIVSPRCSDLFKNLSRLKLNDPSGYAQELSGTRIGNVLDDLGWPAGARQIDAGQSYMQATGALENIGALEHLFLVMDSELGILFIAGNGDVVFQDRHYRLTNAASVTPQATFGDEAGNLKFQDIDLRSDDFYIYNDVRVTRESGAEQVAQDATSITSFGQRSFPKSGLLNINDPECLDQAHYLLSRLKDAALRIRGITFCPQRPSDVDSALHYVQAFSRTISDRITLNFSQASIISDYYIEGINMDWVKGNTLKVQWQLSDANAQQYWAIGVTGLSEIGETTRLAY